MRAASSSDSGPWRGIGSSHNQTRDPGLTADGSDRPGVVFISNKAGSTWHPGMRPNHSPRSSRLTAQVPPGPNTGSAIAMRDQPLLFFTMK
jgi:hypothetical protein